MDSEDEINKDQVIEYVQKLGGSKLFEDFVREAYNRKENGEVDSLNNHVSSFREYIKHINMPETEEERKEKGNQWARRHEIEKDLWEGNIESHKINKGLKSKPLDSKNKEILSRITEHNFN